MERCWGQRAGLTHVGAEPGGLEGPPGSPRYPQQYVEPGMGASTVAVRESMLRQGGRKGGEFQVQKGALGMNGGPILWHDRTFSVPVTARVPCRGLNGIFDKESYISAITRKYY